MIKSGVQILLHNARSREINVTPTGTSLFSTTIEFLNILIEE